MDAPFENRHTFIPLFRPVSSDSDETADNLPGPGRNLGILYAFLGRKLEKGINTFASRAAARPLARDDSIDSNATADNLPGPGRNLGRLYVHLGNKFINALGKFLARRGHGPDAVAQSLSRLRRHDERDIYEIYFECVSQGSLEWTPTDLERKKLRSKCKKLVKYSRSRVDSVAISACNYIANLSLYDPYIKWLLSDCLPSFDAAALADLEQCLTYHDIDADPLLATSRKALISVNEVDVHRMWSEFYVASIPGGLMSSNTKEWYSRMDPFLSNLGEWFDSLNEEIALSFLGFRHILYMFQSSTKYIGSIREDESWRLASNLLGNVIHHLLNILALYLSKILEDNAPTTAIDWDTLESLFGREGKISVWEVRLMELWDEVQSGHHTDLFPDDRSTENYGGKLCEEIEIIFMYVYPDCVGFFSSLCQRHGREWFPPTHDNYASSSVL